MFVNDVCRPGPLLFIHFRCLDPRLHYYARPIRFGSRVPSEEVRAFSFPSSPRFPLGYVTEVNWPRRPGTNAYWPGLGKLYWIAFRGPAKRLHLSFFHLRCSIFVRSLLILRNGDGNRNGNLKQNKQNKIIALVSKTTLHLHRAFCLLRRNDEILSFLKNVKGKAITFAVSKARTWFPFSALT